MPKSGKMPLQTIPDTSQKPRGFRADAVKQIALGIAPVWQGAMP
jgi:hypothetical protein